MIERSLEFTILVLCDGNAHVTMQLLCDRHDFHFLLLCFTFCASHCYIDIYIYMVEFASSASGSVKIRGVFTP